MTQLCCHGMCKYWYRYHSQERDYSEMNFHLIQIVIEKALVK